MNGRFRRSVMAAAENKQLTAIEYECEPSLGSVT